MENNREAYSIVNVFSWAIYDLANTIYSAVVVTVYLPLYITTLSGKNTPVGVTATASMVAAGFLVPFLGNLIDRTGKAKFFLFVSTTLCVGATAAMSLNSSATAILISFFAANLMYHSSLVFYNTLLPSVAPPESQGFASGLGTGLGYAGTLIALPIAYAVDLAFGRRWVFLIAAILFFLFAIPIFLKVPEMKKTTDRKFNLRKSIQNLLRNKPVLYFLAGNFFLVDSLNAAILWLSVFLTRVFSISGGKLIGTILLLNFAACLFGIFLGKLTDRIGSKRVMLVSVACLAACIGTLITFHSFRFALPSLIIFGGAALAGTWTAGRKLLILLAPPGKLGEYFGFYGFTTRVSAIGSSVLAILADSFGFRVAILSQIIPVALAFLLIAKVRVPSPEETAPAGA